MNLPLDFFRTIHPSTRYGTWVSEELKDATRGRDCGEQPGLLYSRNEKGDLDIAVVDDVPRLLQLAQLGAELEPVLNRLGGKDKLKEKFSQMHRVGARLYGGRWVWANEHTAHAYQESVGGESHAPNVIPLLKYLGSLAALRLCEEIRGQRLTKRRLKGRERLVVMEFGGKGMSNPRFHYFGLRWLPKKGDW